MCRTFDNFFPTWERRVSSSALPARGKGEVKNFLDVLSLEMFVYVSRNPGRTVGFWRTSSTCKDPGSCQGGVQLSLPPYP